MSSLKVGQVCPGYTGCPMLIHHALTFCDVVFPYILGLLLLPMIVKANDLAYSKVGEREPSLRSPRSSLSDRPTELEMKDIEAKEFKAMTTALAGSPRKSRLRGAA